MENNQIEMEKIPAVLQTIQDKLDTKDLTGAKNQLRRVIDCLKTFLTQESHRLEADLGKAIDITNELTQIIGETFSNYGDHGELLQNIEKESAGFMLLKQIYQLSHLHGIINERIKTVPEISINHKRHFTAKFYHDCVETFAKLILILLTSKREASLETKKSNYLHIFLEAAKLFQQSTFKHLKNTTKGIAFYRNPVAHSQLFFFNNEMFLKSEEGKPFKKINPQEFLNLADTIWSLLIIYTTALDIQLLELYADEKLVHQGVWNRYFKVYTESWQELKIKNQ